MQHTKISKRGTISRLGQKKKEPFSKVALWMKAGV